MALSKPFTGPQRRLVLAFDIGTTFSGAAYTILDPEKIPRILPITRYPKQENGDFKIPSVLYYTQDGKLRAVGAEASTPEMKIVAEDEGLIYVEWFKLHLRPGHLTGMKIEDLPPLPQGKSAIDVLSDYLGYLYDCARKYIQESHASGDLLWSSVQGRIDFVLSHPNGWEGSQQSKMRQAAVRAGLVPHTEAGRSRIHFVTEGEASLHFCLDSGLATEITKAGAGVMIIDAGGGTVDMSTYTITKPSPITIEEVSSPECILHGSTTVNVRAQKFLEAKLKNSRYKDDIPIILERFEKTTKPTFKDTSAKAYIHFGSVRDRDPEVGIRSGQLVLEGDDVAKFFQPSVDAIIAAIRAQLHTSSATSTIQTAFFVGGFAASPWLHSKLQSSLKTTNVKLCRPDNHTNKAVAEGAISFFVEHYVTVRIAKFTYGSEAAIPFDLTNPEHALRTSKAQLGIAGNLVLPNAFYPLLTKGSRIREAEELSLDMSLKGYFPQRLSHIDADIICYRGKNKQPTFTDTEPSFFATLCTIKGDTSDVPKEMIIGLDGTHFAQDFKVILLCGLTEMKAQIAWIKDGVEVRGPAQIVYDIEATG